MEGGGEGREISKILEQYYPNNGSKGDLVLPSSSLIKLFTSLSFSSLKQTLKIEISPQKTRTWLNERGHN